MAISILTSLLQRMRLAMRFSGLSLLLLLSFVFLQPLSAQETNNEAPSNRWLLIVDTSNGMKERAESAHQILARLLASGVNGQLREGDSIGVWTFNDDLETGVFPLQIWTPQAQDTIAERVYKFLQAQKHEKSSRLDRLAADMNQVIKASDFITVIILSDGSSRIRGTPFDDQINASYKEWQEQQRKRQLPFVTLLRAEHGTVKHFAVNTPPFPFDLPPLPEELLKPRTTPPPKTIATEKPKTPAVVPSLILSGRKPEPVVTQTPPVPPAKPKTALPSETVSEDPAADLQQHPSESTSTEPTNEKTIPSGNGLQNSAAKDETPPAISALPSAENTASPAPEWSTIQPSVPIENAVSLQTKTTSRTNLLIIAGAISGLLLIGAILFLRRPRNSTQASLITRSLDRDQR